MIAISEDRGAGSRRNAIVINKNTTAAEFEAAVDQALAIDPNPPLKLATNWELARNPGGAARAAQLVISWARAVQEPVLISYASGPDDLDTIFKFTRQLHGLAGAMLATRVLASNGSTDITSAVNTCVKRRVEAMNALDFSQIQRGQAVDLVCVDPSSLARLRPFYHSVSGDAFRTQSEFETLAGKLIARNAPSYERGLGPILKDLAVTLRELFINTHYHARHDGNGERYRRGIRAITVAQRNVALPDIDGFSGGLEPLRGYLNALKRVEDRRTIKLVELTVIDSGPGFAARMNGGELSGQASIERERELVQDCFLKNVTSITDQGYGLGLTRILQALKTRRGFLSLRTGRLALFKFFSPEHNLQSPALTADDFRLQGIERADGAATWGRPVAGTVVTILVPVGNADQ